MFPLARSLLALACAALLRAACAALPPANPPHDWRCDYLTIVPHPPAVFDGAVRTEFSFYTRSRGFELDIPNNCPGPWDEGLPVEIVQQSVQACTGDLDFVGLQPMRNDYGVKLTPVFNLCSIVRFPIYCTELYVNVVQWCRPRNPRLS